MRHRVLLVAAGLALAACSTVPGDRRPPIDDARGLLREAEARVAGRAYPAAGRLFETVVRGFPDDPAHDRALYGLGRLLLLADNPARSYTRALAVFDRLLREHPESDLAPDARAWRSLLAAYLARTDDLERLKQADLELERRSRPEAGRPR